MEWYHIAVIAAVGVACLFVGFIVQKSRSEKTLGNAETTAKNLISDAERKAEEIRKERLSDAKEEARRIRKETDDEIKERRDEVKKQERRLQQKEENVDRKLDSIDKKLEQAERREKALATKENDLDAALQRQNVELQKISGYTKDEAKQILLDNVEREIRTEAAALIRDIESEAREKGEAKAKEIIIGAIQRTAADHVAETTVSVVPLPNDEMKGRIIGREGRNIRAIETMTGIDLIIDDTPEAVVLSGFDPVKREVAKL
ncbi:MAG: Rnase Y domain-containing protein, partial [Clostridiales Family XIII bacterium]|nr:Rnase Y domain-containing protein [Clostridiales Family XIII bacterium]